MSNARKKTKKCAVCGLEFRPSLTTQRVCGVECAVVFGRKKVADMAKKERSERRRDLLPISHWVQLTQSVVNKYIRLRDKGMPCISCGKISPSQFHAGHYRSAGAHGNLRFDERNINAQCAKCNTHLSGNLTNYRIGLIEKIGEDQVLDLERDNKTVKWTRAELDEIRKKYKNKIKDLEIDRG